MGFVWSESVAEGTIIDNEDLLEVENRIDILGDDILLSNPDLPSGTPGCPNNDPNTNGLVWGQRGEDTIAIEERADISARNLDYIRENNWCRGHYSGQYLSVKTSDESNVYTADEDTVNDNAETNNNHNEEATHYHNEETDYNTSNEDSKLAVHYQNGFN